MTSALSQNGRAYENHFARGSLDDQTNTRTVMSLRPQRSRAVAESAPVLEEAKRRERGGRRDEGGVETGRGPPGWVLEE
jgi:hypothetical protein